MSEQEKIRLRLEEMFVRLRDSLSQSVEKDGFAERTFYAEAFAAVVFSYDTLGSVLYKNLLSATKVKWNASEDVRQHLEFLWYAQELFSENEDQNPLNLPMKFSHTIRVKPTNWILLRLLHYVRHGSKRSRWIYVLLAKFVVQANWKDKMILDRGIGAMVRAEVKSDYASQQYMAFMLVLLSDLYELTGDLFFKTKFFSGLDVLRISWKKQGFEFTKGRGAYQLFGASSFVYALSWAVTQHDDDDELLQDLNIAILHLSSFQNVDGSFPLVLRDGENKDLWESYNNSYDYQAFCAVMLMRSMNVFPQISKKSEE